MQNETERDDERMRRLATAIAKNTLEVDYAEEWWEAGCNLAQLVLFSKPTGEILELASHINTHGERWYDMNTGKIEEDDEVTEDGWKKINRLAELVAKT